MKTLEQELRDWMRPVSPLTAFYLGCRNEGEDARAAATKVYVDPTEGIDLDELPKELREKLENLKTSTRAQFDENAQLEERRKKAEEFARQQQSRADRLDSIVRKHNLGDATPPPGGGNPNAAKVAELEQRLKADGLNEQQASAYAKMLSTANDLERQRIYSELQPLFAEVQSLRAGNFLANARSQYPQVFAIPELAKHIVDNVAVLTGKGQPIDNNTIDHLVQMAWGQYALKNPDKIGKKPEDDPLNGQIPNLGGGHLGNGGHVNNPGARKDGEAPRATQADTVRIMQGLNTYFEQDLPSFQKKGKK